MPFGPYRLRSSGVNKSLNKAQARYQRLCGEVVIVQKADPEKLKKWREKQKELNKRKKKHQEGTH